MNYILYCSLGSALVSLGTHANSFMNLAIKNGATKLGNWFGKLYNKPIKELEKAINTSGDQEKIIKELEKVLKGSIKKGTLSNKRYAEKLKKEAIKLKDILETRLSGSLSGSINYAGADHLSEEEVRRLLGRRVSFADKSQRMADYIANHPKVLKIGVPTLGAGVYMLNKDSGPEYSEIYMPQEMPQIVSPQEIKLAELKSENKETQKSNLPYFIY